MSLSKDYLEKVWDSVWQDGLTELEIQKKYFQRLSEDLKGEDRSFLEILERKINELEIKMSFNDLVENEMKLVKNDNSPGLNDSRTEGDGTEWIIEKDEEGNLFKRAIGSEKKVYLKKDNLGNE